MLKPWSREFLRLLVDVLIFWLLGAIIGHPHWGVVAGVLSYFVHFMWRLHRFEQWLDEGYSEPVELGGVFDELSVRIFKLRHRSRKRKKRLTELLRRWQESSSMLPDAAVVIDKSDNIEWFNTTASSMLGLKPSDIGQHITNLIRSPRFVHYLESGDFREHLELASPTDVSRVLNIRVTPYGTKQHLLMISDVTHIQRLMTMRRDFVANVSHELRTPLTVILGYLETIREDDEEDMKLLQPFVQRMEAPALRMKTLVEDLLMLSGLDTEAPTTPDNCEDINVSVVMRGVVSEAEQISQGKHEIHVQIDSHLLLKGVEKEIYSAFLNLVSNAVRYTPEGTRIDVFWGMENDEGIFRVSDNGPGIAPEHIPRLTERFYRVDVGRSRQTGGTGLGLAIVKQVLRRHDAELNIESDVDQGAVFTCVFPQVRLSAVEPAAEYTDNVHSL